MSEAKSPENTGEVVTRLQPGQPGTRYRHIKRGSEYTLLNIGQVQCDQPIKDYDRLLSYRDDSSGVVWYRSPIEFFDKSRFQRIEDAVASPEHRGWIFHSPDTGTEWSDSHPTESGEVPDAQDIKAATAEVLLEHLLDAWKVLAETEAKLAAKRAVVS